MYFLAPTKMTKQTLNRAQGPKHPHVSAHVLLIQHTQCAWPTGPEKAAMPSRNSRKSINRTDKIVSREMNTAFLNSQVDEASDIIKDSFCFLKFLIM